MNAHNVCLHRIASRWPQDFVGLAFVYICLLAAQVMISQLPTNSPQNLRPTGRNTVYVRLSGPLRHQKSGLLILFECISDEEQRSVYHR